MMKDIRIQEKRRKWKARKARSAKSIERAVRPRVVIYRSAKHIYAQLTDAESGQTIGTVSTRQKSLAQGGPTGNIDAAKKVGVALAELAKEKNIQEVVLSRNGFLFHGRVKALADAAREAGLRF